jgi:hypothetical protein
MPCITDKKQKIGSGLRGKKRVKRRFSAAAGLPSPDAARRGNGQALPGKEGCFDKTVLRLQLEKMPMGLEGGKSMKKYPIVLATVLLMTFVVVRPSLAGEPGAAAAALDQGGGQSSLYGVLAGAQKAPLQSDPKQSNSHKTYKTYRAYKIYSPFINFKTKYDEWLSMVERTHNKEQPDWMTPVVTVTPTLQQEIRTDFNLSSNKGLNTDTFLGKGTEIIPTENTEIIFGNPTWVTKDVTSNRQIAGWADWSTLFKYRLLSSPSDAGNYVVTFLLGTSFDTGSTDITAGHDAVTPMLGFGKGFETSIGEFDYQATIGPTIPGAEFTKFGTPVTWNSAFQYGNRFCIFGYMIPLWPEFEVTWITFPNGAAAGQQQVYLTPGINIGRFQLTQHTYFVIGAGYQFAATSDRSFGNQWIVTMRIPYF